MEPKNLGSISYEKEEIVKGEVITKTVTGEVLIRQLNFGETNDLMQACVTIENNIPKQNHGLLRELTIVAATVSGPYVVTGNKKETHDNIRALPKHIGEWLYEQIDKLHAIDPKKGPGSDGQ